MTENFTGCSLIKKRQNQENSLFGENYLYKSCSSYDYYLAILYQSASIRVSNNYASTKNYGDMKIL